MRVAITLITVCSVGSLLRADDRTILAKVLEDQVVSRRTVKKISAHTSKAFRTVWVDSAFKRYRCDFATDQFKGQELSEATNRSCFDYQLYRSVLKAMLAFFLEYGRLL